MQGADTIGKPELPRSSSFRTLPGVGSALALALALSLTPVCWNGAAQARPGGKQAKATAQGGARDLGEILRRLQSHYRQTDSFSAKFNEEIVSAGGGKRQRSGTVYYLKPARMRWEFSAPSQETIVSDGKTLYDYQPDLDQVIKTPLARAFASSAPMAFLLGVGDIQRDFKASRLSSPSADHLLHLGLAPKDGGAAVELALEPASYDISVLEVTDQLGNKTTISFSELQTNLHLPDALFVFKVPDGVDLVEAPGATQQGADKAPALK